MYKVLTHDLRPPVQGGDPLFCGELPMNLPEVVLDRGDSECAPGWNFCKSLPTALRIGGLWPTGRPSRAFVVEPLGEVVERGDKCRTSKLRIVSELSKDDVESGIREMSIVFAELADEMIEEQIQWRRALARPMHDEAVVVEGLKQALEKRGLKWTLKKYDNAQSALAAWDARDAWDARAARAAGAAWDAWAAWAAAWAAAGAAARAAGDARAALLVFYVAKKGWIDHASDLLTVGIRDAYQHGLEIALPVGNDTLGWSMSKN